MAIPIIFFAIVLLQLNLAFGNIAPNATLSTNNLNAPWLSSSGEFAFGFHTITNSTSLLLLAIWFNDIPNRTVVWNADIEAPIPQGSMVQLTQTGLSLTNPQGQALWATGELREDVSHAEMRDDGNFVLVASLDSSYLWQSFNNPTDTLLPNQTLNTKSRLFSRLSPTNYTKGRFELYFENGSLSLTQIVWPTESRYNKYFDIRTSPNNTASKLVFTSSGIGGQRVIGLDVSVLDVGRYHYRATLDYYGVLTLYSHPKESNEIQVWSNAGYVPENICQLEPSEWGSGCCGDNSYCSWDDSNKRPNCKCPDGYSWVDPNIEFGGCRPDLSIGCGSDDARSQENPQEVYQMKPLPDVNWPYGDYERLTNYTLEQCLESCLYDCNCAAVVSNPNDPNYCWKKRFPLTNGRKPNYGIPSYLKTRIQPLVGNLNPTLEKKDGVQPALLGSLIGSLVIIILLLATIVSFILLKSKRVIVQEASFVETNMHSFTYEALKEATDGFNEEVGRGSFGIVYKGTLKSATDTIIAVKRLDRLAQEREREFKNELSAIGKTCHRNLVRLIGFCDEGVHRLLVYEFMSNGTLADILFKEPKPIWNLRVKFALGIIRGLLYLHEECETAIIHCDIKPQNILIDEHFIPKISDFGLAKLLYSNKSRTHTMIRGTRGYVAPEWFKSILVTAKVDVYSYGVMLLEIICCRRSLEKGLDEVEEGEPILIDWVYDCYMEGKLDNLVGNDEEAIAELERVKKWVMIAIWCIQDNPETRPNVKTVMQMLEGLVEVPSPPTPSSFISTV